MQYLKKLNDNPEEGIYHKHSINLFWWNIIDPEYLSTIRNMTIRKIEYDMWDDQKYDIIHSRFKIFKGEIFSKYFWDNITR